MNGAGLLDDFIASARAALASRAPARTEVRTADEDEDLSAPEVDADPYTAAEVFA